MTVLHARKIMSDKMHFYRSYEKEDRNLLVIAVSV